MTTVVEYISQLKDLCVNLKCNQENLSRIQEFLSDLEVEIKTPCPNSPDSETDESEIKNFLESFQSFLVENQSVNTIPINSFLVENQSVHVIPIDSFLTQIKRPHCRCPVKPCRAQSRIIEFIDLFGANSRPLELE